MFLWNPESEGGFVGRYITFPYCRSQHHDNICFSSQDDSCIAGALRNLILKKRSVSCARANIIERRSKVQNRFLQMGTPNPSRHHSMILVVDLAT